MSKLGVTYVGRGWEGFKGWI